VILEGIVSFTGMAEDGSKGGLFGGKMR
jgi:hypothetical protein